MERKSVSPKTDKKILALKNFGINLLPVVLKYGPRFAFKVVKVALSKKHTGDNYVDFVIPGVSLDKIGTFDEKDCLEMLNQAGFSIKKKSEPFIDEVTGDVVSIMRYKIKVITHHKRPYSRKKTNN
jgi:hypothetical protein